MIDGSLDDTFESDDQRISFNPGFTLSSEEAPVWLIFDATVTPAAPSLLELTAESQVSTPGLELTVEAFNFTTNSFDIVGVDDGSFNVDRVLNIDLSDSVQDFVEAGAVQARLGWRQTGFVLSFPWIVQLDQLFWTVE